MANAGQNTLDIFYPSVLDSFKRLDAGKTDEAIKRLYDLIYKIQPPIEASTASSVITDGFIDQFLIKLSAAFLILTDEVFAGTTAGATWNAHELFFSGIKYDIPAGSTTNRYIYWKQSNPVAYLTSATLPTLGENDFIIALYDSVAGTVLEVWQPRNKQGSSGAVVTASAAGTTNVIPKWASGPNFTLTNSLLSDDGSNVFLGGLQTAKSFLFSGASTAIVASIAPTNGQLLIGSTGNVPVVANITGTAKQVVVTNGAGSITLSTPQDLDTTAVPHFQGLRFGSISALSGGETITGYITILDDGGATRKLAVITP